jgi:hypothetical protein
MAAHDGMDKDQSDEDEAEPLHETITRAKYTYLCDEVAR